MSEGTLRHPNTVSKEATGIARARKLYLPYSGLPRWLRGRQGMPSEAGLVFHWFRVDRGEPVAPYRDLVLSYANLNEKAQGRARALVDEMLTEEEFGLLRDYLFHRYGQDTRTTVLVAPLPSLKAAEGTRAGAFRPYQLAVPKDAGERRLDELTNHGFYHLEEEEEYSLPFVIWGYYASAFVTRGSDAPATGALPSLILPEVTREGTSA